ncbi:MAG: hypothetical protein AAF560_14955 [Acidobacteriota bacterium]
MLFAFRQLAKAYRNIPIFFRMPQVRWRVFPFLFSYTRRYLSEVTRYQMQLWSGPEPQPMGDLRLTVVLISYRRIANMDTLTKGFLRLPFVDRIIVSNNHPKYRIREWIRSDDPRLILMDQPKKTGPGIRFDLARDFPADYYLTVDDDIFLTPQQIRRLFEHLVDQPETPHGIFGQQYVGRGEVPPQLWGWKCSVTRIDTEVDVLNRVYAFTREHLNEYFRHIAELGLGKGSEIFNGEDVILSASGKGRPRIHDLGPWLDCILEGDPGIALHQTTPSFMVEREALHLELQRINGARQLS